TPVTSRGGTPSNLVKSATKSVTFNRFVEEKRMEIDRRTGKVFSSNKSSRKLFEWSPSDVDVTMVEEDEDLNESKPQIPVLSTSSTLLGTPQASSKPTTPAKATPVRAKAESAQKA